MNGRHSAFLHS